jgi:hypothetical protein
MCPSRWESFFYVETVELDVTVGTWRVKEVLDLVVVRIHRQNDVRHLLHEILAQVPPDRTRDSNNADLYCLYQIPDQIQPSLLRRRHSLLREEKQGRGEKTEWQAIWTRRDAKLIFKLFWIVVHVIKKKRKGKSTYTKKKVFFGDIDWGRNSGERYIIPLFLMTNKFYGSW